MSVLQAVILGIVQGLAEFLPISSSGHLLLAERLLGVRQGGMLLTVLLHAGTLVAVLAVFWRDWLVMLRNPFKNRVFWLLVLATLPAVAVALLFEKQIDALFTGWFLGFAFLITGGLLLAADVLPRRAGRGKHAARGADLAQVSTRRALLMGAMQAVAILPGVSRSGATLAGGLWSGLNRTTAAKFSFMMSAPVILGSLVLEAKDVLGEGTALQGGWLAPLVGVAVAGVCGYLAIRWMLALVQRASLKGFALYVSILGLLVLADQLFFGLFFDKMI
ncbi:MAG: undecaprenyl-diphosphate phosphatase [Oscillospiraceae bacterium]|jgi:undecaprenyl-diphosphatase|nr:undecaprenyl-diphosphate phosphatase [Oscillospiraceae bacterium]